LFNERNQDVKDLLIQPFSNANAKVGEGGLTGDTIVPNSYQPAIVLPSFRIVKDKAEVLDGSDSVKIAEKIQQEKRNGVIAGTAKDGIGTGCNGADEREIDNRGDQLRDAAVNRTVVIDMDKFLAEPVVRKPAGRFLWKRFTVPAVDKRIDFPELSDNIANCKAGGFAHLKAPRVSREDLPPSKTLPGNPFLFVNTHRQTSPTHSIQTNASESSVSTNAGGMALRSLSCA
jgi:hypothetical protein